MKPNEAMEITQVGNGFMVRPQYQINRDMCVPFESVLVFRTMSELQSFLAEHFSHRAAPKLVDRLPAKAKK